MRVLPAAVLLACAVLLAGCSDPDGGHEVDPTQAHPIAMHGGMYEPNTITVPKGDGLLFQAHDAMHSAKSADGTYDAGDIPQGTEKTIDMDTPGTFVFKCRFHSAMQLTVTVTA